MPRILTTLLLLFLFSFNTKAGEYEEAWKLINQRKFTQARMLLERAAKNPATSLDASLTLLFLQSYEGKTEAPTGLVDAIFKSEGRDAYIFAIWFNDCFLGDYGKKDAAELQLLNKIISDPSMHNSLRSAGRYVKAMHHLFSNDYDKAKTEWAAMESLQEWQFLGPFENLSGSGFDIHHASIIQGGVSGNFKGVNDIDVSWFEPLHTNREGWMFPYAHFSYNSAVIYAQTFVYAPQDMEVMVNSGASGSVKIWVNDGLVLSEAKERVTELDYYKNKASLKKGYNRILLQLGYTNNSFPNYILRLTDVTGKSIAGITSTSKPQPFTKGVDAGSVRSMKHFAEEYFEKRLLDNPGNFINYLLLSQTYLRNKRTAEARRILEKALEIEPENSLIRFELMQSLLKEGNRTLLLQELERMKEMDPESKLVYQNNISDLMKEEKYSEAMELLDKMEGRYGEDENSLETRASLLGKLEKIEDLVKLVEKAHARYPENLSFLGMMFNVQKLLAKDLKAAINVYEKYLKNNYNYNVLSSLADEYKEQGQHEKYLKILNQMYARAAYDGDFANSISSFYFEKQNYTKSLDYAMEALKLAPYSGSNWYNVGSIQEAMNKKEDAIASYKKAIYYDRTNYEARKKLSTLQNKMELVKLLPETDVYSLIKKAPSLKEEDFSYVFDEKATVVYDVGASEEYITYAIKLHTKKGIESWKEVYLGSGSSQSVIIEKTEAIKPNGSKVPAERNGEEVVFTSLEPGDAIYVKYKLQNHSKGRMGREVWDKFIFNSFAPSAIARYILIIPASINFKTQFSNSDLKPVVKDADGGYKVYTWERKNLPALKNEPLMPPLGDVAEVLHISTLPSWQDVAKWYSDITYQNLTGNVELDKLYNDILGDAKTATPMQKLKKIYNHILTNIRYSSVSFRQSGWIPQDVSDIINTRLGDCKDLSTLFVALANKAGIRAQLVLIDTRDNGQKDMVLPSMDFNHCIALAKVDGKEYYFELTDKDLPFNSFPTNLHGALALVIPPHGEKPESELRFLTSPLRTLDRVVRKVSVTLSGNDEKLTVESRHFGNLSSNWRGSYVDVAPDKQKEQFEQWIANSYKNPIKLESLSFSGLESLVDSVTTKYSFTAKNEVVEAGSMKMIKVPFIDQVVTLDNFSLDTRNFPIEYWNYENTDVYETNVTITIPAGMKILEIPANLNLTFKKSSYSLKYTVQGQTLTVQRIARLQRDDVPAADYAQFKEFFNKIVEAESKFIVFK